MSANKVVAVDGPAGSGKSTVAKLVAKNLGFTHIDTGAMYRALTLNAVEKGIPVEDEEAVSESAREAVLALSNGKVLLNGEDVTSSLRMGKVTRDVARLSSYAGVRTALLSLQREVASRNDGVVMEGRDIGTVVFPDAQWKFFLDADPEVRARRRHAELAAQGRVKELSWVLEDLIARDKEDRERTIAPLSAARDADVIDSSHMTIEEVVEYIVKKVKSGTIG